MARSDKIPEGEAFSQALSQVRDRVGSAGLPSHPAARRKYVQDFQRSYASLPLNERLSKIASDLGVGGGAGAGGGGNIRSVMPKRYDPLVSPTNKDIPYFDDSETPEIVSSNE